MTKPVVLILCTGNSCRSQMAEGLLRRIVADRFDVHSAGTDPRPEVHPLAVETMREIGIDITRQFPKSIDRYLGKLPVRHLIIVCDRAQQSCPRIWPGTLDRTYIPFDDPASVTGSIEEQRAAFRRVRDEIAAAMETWAVEHLNPVPATKGA
jgi:arsenate reductase